MTETDKKFHSGFAALVGRPNVGKSTLMNALLGEKISIVSAHAQTTRNKITGVWNGDNSQVVFLDTPGMHKPQSKLGEAIRQSTMDALDEVDLILFLCAVNDPLGAGDRYILSLLKDRKVPVILALSKTDLISKEDVLKKIVQYSKIYPFAEIIPLSAKTGENLDELMKCVVKYLPEGPKYFPDDMVTDQPERNIVQEIVREKLLTRTRDEVPHAIGVYTEEFSERENGKVYIRCTIYVERDSQKRIIIGKKAASSKPPARKPEKKSKASSAPRYSSTSGSKLPKTGRIKIIF